jgi:hypothetical protein
MTISFGSNQLIVEGTSGVSGLAGADLHRIIIRLETRLPSGITGETLATANASVEMEPPGKGTLILGMASQVESWFFPAEQGAGRPAVFALDLSAQQLERAEAHRGGQDFRLRLHLSGLAVKATDGMPLVISGEHDVSVTKEMWLGALAQCQFGDVYLWLLRTADLGAAAPALRTARQELDEGRYDDAIVGARKVIDRLWRGEGAKSLVDVGAKMKRDKDQRMLAVADALHDLSSAAAHNDEVTSQITFDRDDAKAILGCVIALAGRQADA